MAEPLIIGAGPAGRSAASALARSGLKPVLIDTRQDLLTALASSADDVKGQTGTAPDLVGATALHAESGRVWLAGAGGVETRPWSHLVIATGLHQVELPDGRAGGWLPDTRLAALLGCAFRFDKFAGWLLPVTDGMSLETSRERVYVIGGARGIADEAQAVQDGLICAAVVAAGEGGRNGVAATAFAPAKPQQTWVDLPAADWPDAAVVCGCLGVICLQLREAIAAGGDSTHHLGRLTGAGEGVCRGRRCALSVALLLSSRTGRPLREVLVAPTEFPAAPVPLDAFVEIMRERPASSPLSLDDGTL